MNISTDPYHSAIDQACMLAKALAESLVEKGGADPNQRRLVSAWATATRTVIDLLDEDDPTGGYSHAEYVEDVASNAIQALAESIKLGDDGYNLSDVHIQLDIAATTIEMLDSVVASSILGACALDWLGDQMHDQLAPFLRLAVRLTDPDKFEFGYVPDLCVQSGARAMALAAHLSRVIASADAEINHESAPSDLAA